MWVETGESKGATFFFTLPRLSSTVIRKALVVDDMEPGPTGERMT